MFSFDKQLKSNLASFIEALESRDLSSLLYSSIESIPLYFLSFPPIINDHPSFVVKAVDYHGILEVRLTIVVL